VLAAVDGLWIWAQPWIGSPTMQIDDGEISTTELPLAIGRPVDRLAVWFHLRTRPLHFERYRLTATGCLDTVTVNGQIVDPHLADVCALTDGAVIDLSDSLRAGRNDVHLRVHAVRPAANIRFEPAAIDPFRLVLSIGMLASGAWLAWAVASSLRTVPFDTGVFAVACGGIALRTLYMLGTYYSERAHDTGPHIDYIKYLATQLRLPPAGGGWEFFQPPLYYAAAAAYLRAGTAVGQSAESILKTLQAFSLICSIATLLVALWIGLMLFPDATGRRKRILYGSVVAAMPSLVFMSSPVSNDPLYETLSFIAGGLLVYWWRAGSAWAWYGCLLAACLAVNTKSSGLVLFPIAFVCLAVSGDLSWRARLRRAALSALLVVGGVGSIPLARAATDPTERHMVTMNVAGLPPALVLPSQPRNFITFDPVQIVSRPENYPWDDSQRRQFLMEFFFRSAFFGEFTFAPQLRTVQRIVLLAALLGLPLVAFGVARELGDAYTEWPMIVAAGALLTAFVGYRMKFPFAPSQDFRYVTFLTVPLTFFAVRGAFTLPRIVRPAGIATLAMLAGSCAAFVLLVIY
jgi:hypothetical protein